MIIRIEDAPAVKHIKIDIDFTGGEAKTTIVQETGIVGTAVSTSGTSGAPIKDRLLDLDETFDPVPEEVVAKPEIDIGEREVKVAADMMDATY